MHRLTCNEADYLAADLERLIQSAFELSCHHGRMSHAHSVIGDHGLAQYHEEARAQAWANAVVVRDYVDALRERRPLFREPVPKDRPRPNAATIRAAEERRQARAMEQLHQARAILGLRAEQPLELHNR